MEAAADPAPAPAKRSLSEAQLRALAKGRKTSLELRKKKSLMKAEEKLKAKAAFDAEWVAAKNRAMGIVEPAPAPVQEPAPAVPAAPRKPEKARKGPLVLNEPPDSQLPLSAEDDFEDLQSEPEPKNPPRAPRVPRAPQASPEDYKQLYYKAKLDLLHQQQQEHDHLSSYGRAPAQVHAYDIARQTLRSKANDLVYRQAYASLFPNG